jgi:hypothetical protein
MSQLGWQSFRSEYELAAFNALAIHDVGNLDEAFLEIKRQSIYAWLKSGEWLVLCSLDELSLCLDLSCGLDSAAGVDTLQVRRPKGRKYAGRLVARSWPGSRAE